MRLADIEARYGDQVRVEWRAYLLRPEPEPRPLDKFTAYTEKWATPAGLEPRSVFRTWSGEHQPPSHSFPSAVAGKVAGVLGHDAHRAYKMRLFEAYFTENRTISDRDVLIDLAGEAGLDTAEFDRIWRDQEDELVAEVWRDYTTAVQSNITGVPAVVLDRKWLIPGAVDTEEYVAAIEKVREMRTDPANGDS